LPRSRAGRQNRLELANRTPEIQSTALIEAKKTIIFRFFSKLLG
jgi:hypothetical protein